MTPYMLTIASIGPIRAFAHQIAFKDNADHRDFANDDLPREPWQVYTDQVMGKLGEQIFCAHAYDVLRERLEPDLTIYKGAMVGDGGADFVIGHNEIDVKTIRRYSRWLLIEKDSFNPSTVYAVVSLRLPKEFEHDTKLADTLQFVKGYVHGYIRGRDMLAKNGRAMFEFQAGTFLPIGPRTKRPGDVEEGARLFMESHEYTGTRLKGNNIAWPTWWLYNEKEEWKSLAL